MTVKRLMVVAISGKWPVCVCPNDFSLPLYDYSQGRYHCQDAEHPHNRWVEVVSSQIRLHTRFSKDTTVLWRINSSCVRVCEKLLQGQRSVMCACRHECVCVSKHSATQE